MAPTLVIGSVALPTYPFFLLVAFWGGLWLAAHRARQLGLDGDHVYNAGLFGLIGGVIGARAWFVVSHWENYAPDLVQALSLSRSALSIEGGLIVAGLIIVIYLQRNQVPLGAFLDGVAPGLVVAIIIGNIGAFLGGEAPGAVATIPWAVEMAGVARHPVQLYEVIAGLVILVVLYFFRQYRPWPGFQFWLFVVLYGADRLLLELFRGRPSLVGNGYLLVQIAALAAMVVALAVMAYNFSNNLAKTD
jgi:phosphatidylglycerol:prolipoprotein diacylglycerol transferase